MKHLDLFSGIGGFALAASWVWGPEHKIHSFVEIEPFCQKVLKKHWPDVNIHDDIRSYKHDGTAIDLLTGGFPCQPFSVAGKRRGAKDDRALWPEMLRVIKEARPTWVIGENVAGIVSMELDNYVIDLESTGYEVQPFIVPACAVDAKHRRDRVWIVAQATELMFNGSGFAGSSRRNESSNKGVDVSNAGCQLPQVRETGSWNGRWGTIKQSSCNAWCQWKSEPSVGRVANGIPHRVDRLRGLGNAIVPQVVVPIMQAIKLISKAWQKMRVI